MGARGEFNYGGTIPPTRMGAKESSGNVDSLNMGNEGDSKYFPEQEENIKDQNVDNGELSAQYAISLISSKEKGVDIKSH